MRLALVVAVAENGVIGREGALPWRLPDDLKWFKRVTLGKPIIMGRKTFDSIGRPLPGRDNIVITRDPAWSVDGAATARSVAAAVALAERSASRTGAEEICVIGGAEIYRQTLARADRIYLTRVRASLDGDARFPEIKPSEWREAAAGGTSADERNAYSCDFFILDRNAYGSPPFPGDGKKTR